MENVLTLPDDGPRLDGERAVVDVIGDAFGAGADTVPTHRERIADALSGTGQPRPA